MTPPALAQFSLLNSLTLPRGVFVTRRSLPNLALIALIVSCFTQIGAQLFAISIIARVVHRPRHAPLPSWKDRTATTAAPSGKLFRRSQRYYFLSLSSQTGRPTAARSFSAPSHCFSSVDWWPASIWSLCLQRSSLSVITMSLILTCKPGPQHGMRWTGRFGSSDW